MPLPNVGYHLAMRAGSWRRKAYQALLPRIVRQKIRAPRMLALDVFSYSNESAVPEQVRSIRSFLRHVGKPSSYTVVSDGTHSAESIGLLEAIDPVVRVRPSGEQLPPDLPAKFHHYITAWPMGKQLGLIMSLPRGNEPALYVDSDVLFFAGAGDLVRLLERPEAPAYYLPDCQETAADPRLFRTPSEARQPVNSGLLLIFRPLDWSLGMERYLELKGDPIFFTNQTIVHLAMHANGAAPLDPRKYVLQLDDQTIYQDRHASRDLVLRHYVNPVRHKFWTHL